MFTTTLAVCGGKQSSQLEGWQLELIVLSWAHTQGLAWPRVEMFSTEAMTAMQGKISSNSVITKWLCYDMKFFRKLLFVIINSGVESPFNISRKYRIKLIVNIEHQTWEEKTFIVRRRDYNLLATLTSSDLQDPTSSHLSLPTRVSVLAADWKDKDLDTDQDLDLLEPDQLELSE